jgi:hypothetical protein
VSELSLNVTPSPELLKPAASDQTRPVPADAARAPDPFATLLAGVLQGAQPPAAGAPGPAATGNFT